MKRPEGKIINRPELLAFRRENRQRPSAPEALMWNNLRGRRIGMHIRRQQGILNYIVDFYCAKVGLVIEIDGPTHLLPQEIEYDRYRQEDIEALGCDFIRFSTDDVTQNPDAVLASIRQRIEALKAKPDRRWWRSGT
jgi:very-short-patch-repair endonuclease